MGETEGCLGGVGGAGGREGRWSRDSARRTIRNPPPPWATSLVTSWMALSVIEPRLMKPAPHIAKTITGISVCTCHAHAMHMPCHVRAMHVPCMCHACACTSTPAAMRPWKPTQKVLSRYQQTCSGRVQGWCWGEGEGEGQSQGFTQVHQPTRAVCACAVCTVCIHCVHGTCMPCAMCHVPCACMPHEYAMPCHVRAVPAC